MYIALQVRYVCITSQSIHPLQQHNPRTIDIIFLLRACEFPAQVRLRFCARRAQLDDSFPENEFVVTDSEPFDVSNGEASHLILDRHPATGSLPTLEGDVPIAGVAGEVLGGQPQIRLADFDARNVTWCGAQYRLMQETTQALDGLSTRADEGNNESEVHVSSSRRFDMFDRDANLEWTRSEFEGYSSIYGGSLTFDAVDSDRNNVIQPRELVEYMNGAFSTPSYTWRLARFDSDLDRKWSHDEYATYSKFFGLIHGTGNGTFEQMDVSGDGFLSHAEVFSFIHAGSGSSSNDVSAGSDISKFDALNESIDFYPDPCSVYVALEPQISTSIFFNSSSNRSIMANETRNISLGGRSRAEIFDGVAKFTDLFLTTASYPSEQRYNLRFVLRTTLDVYTIKSPSFHIAPAAPHKMFIVRAPAGAIPVLYLYIHAATKSAPVR